jgi:hypothetical protein
VISPWLDSHRPKKIPLPILGHPLKKFNPKYGTPGSGRLGNFDRFCRLELIDIGAF